jgi:leader peptidase (prepilin peptidase)/N-methyltransferase
VGAARPWRCGDFLLETWLPVIAAPFVGSFLGVLILRLPVGAPVVFARSACTACGQVLGARDLVPLASWLAGRGRCRHCKGVLSGFYPAIELAALVVALCSVALLSGWLVWASCALGWALLVLAWIDWRYFLLPDPLTLPLIPAGLAVAWAVDPARLPDHLIGACAGFAAFVAIGWLYARLRGRIGLGLGDAKLLAAAGAWISWEGLPGVVLIAALAALAVTLLGALSGRTPSATTRVPFGSYLALGIWLTWLLGPLAPGL